MAQRKMTPAHKKAIAAGRLEAKAVKAYLDGLNAKRGRATDPKKIAARLSRVEEALETETNSLRRLELIQRWNDLESASRAVSTKTDEKAIEAGFVKVAKSYAARKGISYKSLRDVGVPAAVLSKAGISRGGA